MDTRIPGTDDAGGTGRHLSFRTTCGREMRVGHLSLGGSHHPAQRVSLGIGASSAAESGTWAGLTASEARWLAAALLAQAAACDEYPGGPARGPSGGAPGGAPGGPSGGASGAPWGVVSGGPSGRAGHPAT
jgi:hypothetical protein